MKRAAAFSSLSEQELGELSSQCTRVRFRASEQIIRRGEQGDAMFVVTKGKVRIPVLDAAGEERLVAKLGEGDVFGEMALLCDEPRSADVFAEAEVECLKIERAPLEAFLCQKPAVARFLTEVLGRRLLEGDGALIGPYQLRGSLGEGGMGKVYHAWDPE